MTMKPLPCVVGLVEVREKVKVLEDVVRVCLELLESQLEDVSGDLGVLCAVVFHQGRGHKNVLKIRKKKQNG